MTDKNLSNSLENPDATHKTRLTLTIDVELGIENIRELVHLWDADMSGGPEEAIAPANVSAIDFIGMWLVGEYSGNALIITDDWENIK